MRHTSPFVHAQSRPTRSRLSGAQRRTTSVVLVQELLVLIWSIEFGWWWRCERSEWKRYWRRCPVNRTNPIDVESTHARHSNRIEMHRRSLVMPSAGQIRLVSLHRPRVRKSRWKRTRRLHSRHDRRSTHRPLARVFNRRCRRRRNRWSNAAHLSAQVRPTAIKLRARVHYNVCHRHSSWCHFAIWSKQARGGFRAHFPSRLYARQLTYVFDAKTRRRSWFQSTAARLVYQ